MLRSLLTLTLATKVDTFYPYQRLKGMQVRKKYPLEIAVNQARELEHICPRDSTISLITPPCTIVTVLDSGILIWKIGSP